MIVGGTFPPPFRHGTAAAAASIKHGLSSLSPVSCSGAYVRWHCRNTAQSAAHAPWLSQLPGCRQRLGGDVSANSAASSQPFPDIPIPGDDQAARIFTLLSRAEQAEQLRLSSSNSANGSASASGVAVAGSTASSDGAGPPPGPPEKAQRIPQRWRVVGMMALAFVLCNMDKVNMSVAVIPMAKELGWTAKDRGLVSSAFFWGYALTQIPAGWVSTKIGGARVLLVGVALWSMGTLVAPPAAHTSLVLLCASRVFVGLGEGLAPSSATMVMARQVPGSERARAVTTVFGSLDVGSVVGLLVCGPLIHHFGWPAVFYIFAMLGLAWCCAWPLLRPDKRDPLVPKKPKSKPSAGKGTSLPWATFLRSVPVWAIIVAHFCFNWGYYTLLAWLPSYFELALGLSVELSSLLTLIPYVAMICMTPFVGPVADGLTNQGWSTTNVRKLAQGIAFLGPAVCMVGCALLTPHGAAHAAATLPGVVIPTVVALLSLSFAMGAWARGGLYCNHQDLSPGYAGALLGLTNTAGALPGILGVSSAGFLLDATGSWGWSLFYPSAIFYGIGLVVYSLCASSERQDWDEDQD